MAIEIPTIQTIRDRIITDIENEFGQTVPILSRAVFRVYATIIAGGEWLLYKLAQRVALNILPTTAEGDQLDNFAALFSDLSRQEAAAWEGTAGTTGTNGTIIRAGTIYVGTNNIEYTVTADATIAGGVATITIRAKTAGTVGDLAVAAIVTISTRLPDIGETATVATVTTQGQDEESDEDFRARLIDRYALRPQGGSAIDYVTWAKTVSGVTKVWPFTAGASTVDVYFVRENDIGGRIPDAGEITAVADAINQPDRQPKGAFVTVRAPSEISFNVTVTNFLGSGSEQTQADAAMVNYFLGREMFVDDNLSRPNSNIVSQFDLASIVGNFQGAESLSMALTSAPGIPITSFSLQTGQLAVAGTISFVTT